MRHISPNWTPEERLIVIAHIAQKMQDAAFSAKLVSSSLVDDWSQKIQLLVTRPAEFLEHNREKFLD